MEVLIYGIINSMILSLFSLGFALVYSISRVPNFAHGALYITGGFVTWLMMNKLIGIPYIMAIATGIIVVGVVGALIYQLILIRIRGMEISEIIATYAIGLAILEGLRWGGLRGMAFSLPPWVAGSIDIFGISIDYQRLIIVAVGVGTFILLYLFTHHTRIGLALRGIAQDERAAMMLGINSDMTAVVSLAIGSALAGFAAVLVLPLGNIVIEAGYNVLIFAIAVCVIGGLGSWGGTILASFVVGFAQILTEAFLSTHYQMVVALLAIIVTLLIKPSGIFGKQKELEERV
jgi:branched-chain amino acid transport system permease protein